jgi:branched-chain amino acid transport system substrate-binding protein
VPVISLAGGGAIVLPQDGPRKWAFKLSPTEPISIGLVLDHLQKNGKGKSVATIGISTSYGEGFLKSFEAIAAQRGFKVVATEKYNQTDPSVTAQVLKIIAANPDAVYIFAAGTPGALPQIELAQRGYKGLVYQTQGVANNDFLRVGGKSLEGGYMTVAPVLVAEQLPDSNPVKKAALDFVQRFEKAQGPNSRSLFAATAWDALLIVQNASHEALKKGKPGTVAFRAALRDAIEGLRDFVGSEGVYTMSASDHNGVDSRSQVMVRIENGGWKLQP